jgi:outer membrane receptor protein involved in Fe transport
MGAGDMGSLTFLFNGTYLKNLITVLPDGTQFDCAGLYGVTCGTPSPKWRHQLRATWNTPWNMQLSAAWRYYGSGKLDFNTNQPDLQNGFKDIQSTDANIPAYSYLDLAATWRIHDKYTFRAGMNNVFDKTPPLLDANSFGISAPPFGNGNTYPQVYDPLGRVMFVGVTADF